MTSHRELLAFLAFTIVVVLVCMRPVLHAAGWPANHDGAKMFFRTQVFAAHFSQGDLFPVWSGSDAFNLGTPMPAYYQRLYYSLAGALFLLTDDLKSATVLSLAAFMVVGALGMRAAVAVVSDSRALRFVIPAALLLSNYAYTDWLVRGAGAEFSAMMLVPWLIWWSLKLVVQREFSWSIVAIFTLLFYAHNAIALVAVPVPLLAFVLYLVACARADGLRLALLARPALSALATAALIAPALLMQLRMNRDFDPTTKITQDFTIAGGFRDAHDYLLDRDYKWLTSGGGYTVQLNVVSWVALGVLVATTAARHAWRRQARRPRDATTLVLVLLAGYAFLQLRVSQGTYDALPLLPQIQFPWRMLTLITPLLLLAITLLYGARDGASEPARSSRWWAVGACVWLAAYLLVSPAADKDRLPRLATLTSTSDEFYESGEYTPRTRAPGDDRDLTGGELMALYSQLRSAGYACGLHPVDARFEGLERRFQASCSQSGIEPLPVTYSSYTRVWINGRPERPIRNDRDPRLFVQLPAGTVEVRVVEPTFWRVLRGAHP
ncbi:MAG: hypothetical protein QOJ79_1977 [Actinomycetota bacterium]|jgi:hypothetical protein|nr:hypothetical protein [Actinomycetota bacterium]